MIAEPKRKSCGGFALVLVLGLLALATAILVAVVSMARVESRAQENLERVSLARRNALFALRIAIGRLQLHVAEEAGVTFRADYVGAGVFGASWTGVIRSDSDIPVWFVNGEEHGRSVSPNTVVPSPSSRNAESVVMLRRALVSGERVILLKSDIREYLPAVNSTAVTGRYAYWVSDESLKVSLGVRTDLPAPVGRDEYPYPRVGSIFPNLSEMSLTDNQRSQLMMTDQLLIVRRNDSEAGAPFVVNATTLNASWPHVTANSIGAEPNGDLIYGAFNVNSRSAPAWRAVLEAVSPAPDFAGLIDAIVSAERPFRSVADFETNVAEQLGLGGTEEMARILESLGPVLRVRGDTFFVRAYGETIDPLADVVGGFPFVTSSVICEALVQRKFSDNGRYPNGHFEIVYLRWLSPDEV